TIYASVTSPPLSGANCTLTSLQRPRGTFIRPSARLLRSPPVTLAGPLLTVAPPELDTVNTPCVLVPVAIVPKFNAVGLTPICPGARPAPVTRLVELPPLLLNTTLLLNAPTATGRKLTFTVPVRPGGTEYALLPV